MSASHTVRAMSGSNERIQLRISEGVIAWERDEYHEALRIFDEVLAERETFPDVHNRRGLCLALLLGSLPGLMASRLGGMTIVRPFLF